MESSSGYSRNKGLRVLGSEGTRGRRWDRLVVVREGDERTRLRAAGAELGVGGGDRVGWLLPPATAAGR